MTNAMTATVTGVQREEGVAARYSPSDSAVRSFQLRLGMWIFLGTVTMLFAAFSSAFLVRSAGTDWHAMPLPRVLWLNSVVILLSSAVLEFGRWRARQSRWGAAATAVGCAGLMGLLFLAGQLGAWQQLAAAGIFVPTGPYAASFYMMTGLHALHLLAALAVLAWGARRLAGGADGDEVAVRGVASVCATFWHFLGGLWLYLFALMLAL